MGAHSHAWCGARPTIRWFPRRPPAAMFDRPGTGDKALVVALDFGRADQAERLAGISAPATSAGAPVVGNLGGRRSRPDPAFFAGRGKVEEIAAQRRAAEADLVIFDHTLS